MNQMMKQNENQKFSTVRAVAAIAIAGLAASACVTTAEHAESHSAGNIYAGADRMYLNNYVRSLPDREISPAGVSEVVFAEQTPRNEAWLLASYSGVEGARLAHEMFGHEEAEKLDGACERFVKISNEETLFDISDYCDVSVSQLMAYNPSLHSPRFVSNGQIIEIPAGGVFQSQGINRGAAAAKLAQFYSVQPGDNLNKIAYTFGASPADIANLNPGIVDWSILPVGEKLVIPVSAGAGVAVRGAAGSGVSRDVTESYHDDGAPYPTSGSIVAPKPYQMTPIPDSLKGPELSGEDRYPAISVSDRYVASGGKVTLTGEHLPANSDILISRGANGRTMSAVETVRTDDHGNFSTEVSVPGSTNPGGVIFEAKPADGSDKHLSERVSVKKIEADD